MANIDEYQTDLQVKISSNSGVCSVLNCLGISSAKTIEIIFSQIELKDLKIMCLFILYNLDKDNGQYDNLIKKNKYTDKQIKEISKETLEKLVILAKKDKSIAELYRKTINLKENRKSKTELVDSILKIRKIELSYEEKEKMEEYFSVLELEIIIIYFSSPDYQINISQIKRIYFVDDKYINTIMNKLSRILNEFNNAVKLSSTVNIPKAEQTIEHVKTSKEISFEQQLAKLFYLYGRVDFDDRQLKKIIDFVSEKNLKILLDFYYFEGSKEEMIEKYNTNEANLGAIIRNTLKLVKEYTSISLPKKGKFKFYCYHYKNEEVVLSENRVQRSKFNLERHIKKVEILCSIYEITNPVLIEKVRFKFHDNQVNVFLLFSEFKDVLTDEEISIAENFKGNSKDLVKTMKKYINELVAEDLDLKSRIIFSLKASEQAAIIELIKTSYDLEKIFIFSLILNLSDRNDVHYWHVAKILNISEQETRKKLAEAFNEIKQIAMTQEKGNSSELNLTNVSK